MGSRVLLVEDDPDTRGMMKIFLESFGCDVIEASDGYQAVERAVEFPPDLILMDIAMPVLDGVQTTSVIRKHDLLKDVPIVVITAYDDFYKAEALLAGSNEIIKKPVDFNELRPVVQRYLSW